MYLSRTVAFTCLPYYINIRNLNLNYQVFRSAVYVMGLYFVFAFVRILIKYGRKWMLEAHEFLNIFLTFHFFNVAQQFFSIEYDFRT